MVSGRGLLAEIIAVGRWWTAKFLDCVFPKECFACQKEGEYLCSACFSNIQFLGNYCFICNQPGVTRGVCAVCSLTTGLDRIIVAAKYRGNVVGRLVEAYKYDGLEEIKYILTEIIIKKIDNIYLKRELAQRVLIPIPLHRRRFLARGFNQAWSLTEKIAEHYQSPFIIDGLVRIRDTPAQAKLKREERLENMQNAFAWRLEKTAPLQVILVDDILTTGATFSSAAKVLKAVGTKEVWALAICHG